MDLQPPVYDCLLSADAGAHVATGGDDTIQLHTDGVSWDAATWVPAGLCFSYRVVPASGIGTTSRIVPLFIDTATGVSFGPSESDTTMTEDLVLQFDAEGETPDPDDRSALPEAQRAFRAVLPLRMVAEIAPDTITFDGAIVVDDTTTPELVYAVRATIVDHAAPTPAAPVERGEVLGTWPTSSAKPLHRHEQSTCTRPAARIQSSWGPIDGHLGQSSTRAPTSSRCARRSAGSS